MSNKKVSIITTNFNCVAKNAKSYFYEMFRSIHEQDYPYIEHVIVDGGSKDGSVEFINELIKKYGKKEIIFISEPDKGINDATNKGYRAATGDYITLMCNDDFYTKPDAISKLMQEIENGADYAYANSWWLNQAVWVGEEINFAWRHPFLINALIFRKDLLHGEDYLDLKYPMVGDYDFFVRLLKQDGVKGGKVNEVLTILRPGGYSQSSENTYVKEIEEILEKHFDSKYIKGKELWEELHQQVPSILLLLKIKWFCKNAQIKKSVFNAFNFKRYKKYFMRRLEYYVFLKFILKNRNLRRKIAKTLHMSDIANHEMPYNVNEMKDKVDENPKEKYSVKTSREWIETFYDELYFSNCTEKEKVNV